jgi:hypothetical protein
VFGIPLSDILGPAIGAGVGVIGTVGAAWARRRDEKRTSVERLLALYRDPLLAAAFDLQSRLYNIFRGRFLETYYDDQGRGVNGTYARDSTLWIIGQYLGWAEIIRSEVLFLDLGNVRKNRLLQRRLDDVTRAFASDAIPGERLRVFGAHQRAIGEVMAEPAEGEEARAKCLGYTSFIRRWRDDEEFRQWFEPLAADLEEIAGEPREHPRLVSIQRALIDLINLLDRDQVRYPKPEVRGKLPRVDTRLPPHRPWITRFQVHPDEVAGVLRPFRQWARSGELAVEGPTEGAGEGSLRYHARKRLGPLGMRFAVELDLDLDERWVSIDASLEPPRWQRFILRGRPVTGLRGLRWPHSRRRARRLLNDLLATYDRPRLIRSSVARRLRG